MTLLRLTRTVFALSALLLLTCRLPGAEIEQKPANDKKQSEEQQERSKVLIRRAQDKVELDPGLSGVIVWGARFADRETGDGQELQLQGRLVSAEQGSRVEQIVKDMMKSDRYWWAGEGPLEVSAKSMTEGAGTEEMASRFYTLGLESFWRGDYALADNAFARAVAESPRDDTLRYWRIATAVALKQDDRADEKLVPMLRQYPLGSRSPRIARAFERLQGPIRRRLLRAENRVLWTFSPQ